ncbi:ACT domain-containing protein [Cedecea sp. FDAARGOS_727]|uniref:ACT domain-containing protein n=1 Tax=Cedecea sp. FDAARGOS_727 TaxID=2545798 RepID=UPI00143E43E4|nr:ACT domain-containing protein [Cedecea sp. FDAARGOS_727]QIX97708.1 ACT domain-containing protein [Cedecea sp. FDAARGOS_727]
MAGENNLEILLKNASPELNPGRYVFCTLAVPSAEIKDAAIVIIREAEGVTLVLPEDVAGQHALRYDYVASWITLKIHSSLAAVGLTAAFSRVLANKGISCNVVAGYYHDHIFVACEDTASALTTLSSLSSAA